MEQNKTWVKYLKVTLLNAKWIMLGVLLLNLFPFGYLDKMTSSYGLGDEETFWGAAIVITIILLFVYDKKWKELVEKICKSI